MALTRDVVSDGALVIQQAEDGYRFGLDAVLLATDLPDLPQGGHVVDLGAGSGAVGLMVAKRRPDVSVIGLEVQQGLYELLTVNIRHNGLESRVSAIKGDVRQHQLLLTPHSADLVLMNPPYYRTGQGKMSPNRERAAAHQELHGTLRDFVVAAQYVAKPRGYLKVVIPPMRLPDLLQEIGKGDFAPVSARFVHAKPGRDAYLMEWVFRRGGARQLVVRPPLVLDEGEGFTPEVRDRFAGAALEERV
jgi:tRNA1Val (adenine37-N6)-methyltransferase